MGRVETRDQNQSMVLPLVEKERAKASGCHWMPVFWRTTGLDLLLFFFLLAKDEKDNQPFIE